MLMMTPALWVKSTRRVPLRLPLLFRRENSGAARAERQARLERALTEGLRTVADVLKRTAEVIEKRRLSREGFEAQKTFLERTGNKPR
jgi:hypothetical protein